MGVPEVIYSHYQGDEQHDVLILDNLSASGEVILQSPALWGGYVTISRPQVRLFDHLSASGEVMLLIR